MERERAKPLWYGGTWLILLIDVCGVCVFFFFFFLLSSYVSGRKSISAKAEMANFCASITQNWRPKATNINAGRKPS
jgi:hypothetical protein